MRRSIVLEPINDLIQSTPHSSLAKSSANRHSVEFPTNNVLNLKVQQQNKVPRNVDYRTFITGSIDL